MSKNLSLRCAAVCVLVVLLQSNAVGADPNDKISRADGRKLYDVDLRQLAEKVGCYFTLEKYYEHGSVSFPRASKRIDASTTQDAVRQLRAYGHEIVVIRSCIDPKVVHVIDARLFKIESYVMEKRIDFEFSGKIGGVNWALEKKLPKQWRSKRGGIIGSLGTEHITQVSIKAKKQPVREMLTFCLPLKSYNRLLWITTTRKQGKDQYTTDVVHRGPRSLKRR